MSSLVRFTDARGVEWEVWEVSGKLLPADQAPNASTPARGPSRAPWLCFESAADRRRLLAYPLNWASLSRRELEELCRLAAPAASTLTPRGVPVFRKADDAPKRDR